MHDNLFHTRVGEAENKQALMPSWEAHMFSMQGKRIKNNSITIQ